MKYNLRIRRDFANPIKRTASFENSFLPYCISEWEKLSEEIKGLPTVSQFKSKLLIIRPIKRSVFGISNIHSIKLLTKLRVEFSDSRSHRFEHNFNCVDPRCSCLLEDESNPHYLLRCPHYLHLCQNFLGDISTIIGSDISVLPHDQLTDIHLFGGNVCNYLTDKLILKQLFHILGI